MVLLIGVFPTVSSPFLIELGVSAKDLDNKEPERDTKTTKLVEIDRHHNKGKQVSADHASIQTSQA